LNICKKLGLLQHTTIINTHTKLLVLMSVDAGGADAVVVGADFVVVAAIVGGVVVAGFVVVAK